MARIFLIEESDHPELAGLIAKIRAGRRGALINVYKLLLHAPPLAEIWLALINAFRTYSVLDARLEIVKAFTEILQVEEKADRASRDKVRTIKRDISEGSEEWDILQKRYYAEELKKFGIDPSR